ncbi:MAG: alpha-L-rhamnosidase C-terminal domain-containing protein, partial [Phycisphaeraceae bacterium]|nr:alpha-L-rhamnosidase C-terminal domain-containing protein [Phycisphaeraceae bacterium]
EPTRVTIPTDPRHENPSAIPMPEAIGEVTPFRYAEIEPAGDLNPDAFRQITVHYPFDDNAASFESSSDVLNAVWELCHYTIKATTFCGVYVDGDRERIPYEGDAYINQLGHYTCDREYQLARYTHEYLLQRPTWPTEWHLHSVMMAWADYLYSGEAQSLAAFYDTLALKTLADLARPDGLISTESDHCDEAFERKLGLHREGHAACDGLRDLVDWPPGSFTDGGTGERDDHKMQPINTVVNAFHIHTLRLMANIADALGRDADREQWSVRAEKAEISLNEKLFDQGRGIYIDGEGSDHASLHSNMFPLAFGLVPRDRQASVIGFVRSRGMACSVYGAQHLLDGLYRHRQADHGLALMTATHDHSWWHMREVGSTMTLEAWDHRYKNNLDWSHAWGAAPANILPRWVLGVRPLAPGFTRLLIDPQPAGLAHVAGVTPTPLGPVKVAVESSATDRRQLTVTVPDGATATVNLGDDLTVPAVGPGEHVFTVG